MCPSPLCDKRKLFVEFSVSRISIGQEATVRKKLFVVKETTRETRTKTGCGDRLLYLFRFLQRENRLIFRTTPALRYQLMAFWILCLHMAACKT